MVKLQLLMPQEIEVYYIIPTIRSYLASCFKEHGMSQKEMASIMGIQESTVSQYLTQKRAAKFNFNEELKGEIMASASRIKNKLDLIREVQHLLRLIRHSREICTIHKQLSDIPSYCDASQMGCDKM